MPVLVIDALKVVNVYDNANNVFTPINRFSEPFIRRGFQAVSIQ
ncbi:hypothetical protein URH17368_1598 [Alicyclobacillus hesperidum URH17-3-68]|nr:hypothetical protein URH17368_1598 [Alicyclobacillus hesperidum URH17-3-68]